MIGAIQFLFLLAISIGPSFRSVIISTSCFFDFRILKHPNLDTRQGFLK